MGARLSKFIVGQGLAGSGDNTGEKRSASGIPQSTNSIEDSRLMDEQHVSVTRRVEEASNKPEVDAGMSDDQEDKNDSILLANAQAQEGTGDCNGGDGGYDIKTQKMVVKARKKLRKRLKGLKKLEAEENELAKNEERFELEDKMLADERVDLLEALEVNEEEQAKVKKTRALLAVARKLIDKELECFEDEEYLDEQGQELDQEEDDSDMEEVSSEEDDNTSTEELHDNHSERGDIDSDEFDLL